ncbi:MULTISPECIES: autotransporter outer membrane beta-barrel domain-containing protein [unclassified Pseudomonas]|uniref:autotransporter family protein n=1 Tax=unclassified Pseudomonas TaxID=196821 RepID=UPI000A1FDA8A|nr:MULTISPECIES: autotransporter outer membrane beta-barrel domain-containing protein [unclassified Pseudomonas]
MKSPGFPAPYAIVRLALSIGLASLLPQGALAACAFSPTQGDDRYVCDSPGSGPLTDLSGNNSLTFPTGGNGSVPGNVTFGGGADRVLMQSGTIQGDLDMGDGANVLQIDGGRITGEVHQHSGVDTFIMNGGTIASLAQGDGYDQFTMTGGTIAGAFEDGDSARMSGGTIGRVDMKLDDNVFDLSGGQILGNLVTGFGRDTIVVSGGRIGGNLSVSGGDDSVTVSGGEIVGEVRTSFGNDRFLWDGGGIIRSAVLMGDNDDSATLRNLDDTLLGPTPRIDGGLGQDTLTYDNTRTALAQRAVNWETVNLSNGSQLDLAAARLVLGDPQTGSGVLNIDASSVLSAAQGEVAPAVAGRAVTVNNAGAIDLTRDNTRTDDTLTIQGNYAGNGGQLRLQSQVADDGSPSDRLVVNNGSLTGTTVIAVTNLQGTGALTRENGIELVQALGTATSDNTAFSLRGPVSAGAYDYFLFKGGVTAGTENNWYLRSAVVAPQVVSVPNPDPALPPLSVPVVPVPVAAPVTASAASPGTPAVFTPVPLPVAVPGAAPIPLYRPEVPTWSVLPPVAALLTLNALGTYHERQGDQRLTGQPATFGAGWARAYGNQIDRTWAGTVAPRLDGSLTGFQVGHDLMDSVSAEGRTHRVGFFIGHSRLRGDVDGFNQGISGKQAGKVRLEGDSGGLYWTLLDPQGWYVDTVAMGTRFSGDSRSDRGLKLDNRGHALTLSVESGYPMALDDGWAVEPQVQVIHQNIALDSQDDGVARVSFHSDDSWTGRLGVRLKGNGSVWGRPVHPYLRANLWRTFAGTDSVTFDDADRIDTRQAASTAQVGLGVTVSLAPSVAVYASTDYSRSIDSNDSRELSADLGLRIEW